MFEDTLMGPRTATDRFIHMLKKVSEKDAAVFDKLASEQEDAALTAMETAKAASVNAKANQSRRHQQLLLHLWLQRRRALSCLLLS